MMRVGLGISATLDHCGLGLYMTRAINYVTGHQGVKVSFYLTIIEIYIIFAFMED